jgi:DNA-binding PadR family transcriptional regulator
VADQFDPYSVLPLTPAVFHVLLALAGGERHGYRIMQDVAEHTGGAIRMGAGTLYGTLQRLLEQGWVDEASGEADAARDERRRYYRLSARGRRVLGAEVERLESVVRTARALKGVPRPSKG